MTICKSISAMACLTVLAFAAAAEDSIDAGRDLYLRYQCWQCHGYEGQGGAAARLASVSYTYEAFARFLRNPNVMPAYPPSQLSDEELQAIFNYVRSIPEPPALKEIPALSDE